jgi:uncharacterized membrane protein
MMAMAKHIPMPKWRNFAAWSAVGALFYVLVVSGFSAVRHPEGISAMFQSREVVALLFLSLLFSSACAGFSSWKRPLTLRTFRNFMLQCAVAAAAFLLVMWGFTAVGRVGAVGVSEWVAAVTGATLVVLASMGILAMASARVGAGLIDDEMAAEEMRERGRLFFYSFVWMVACGLLLIVLGLAGAGVLSPTAALAGALVLIVVLVVLGVATWRLSDELGRTLSHESGNMAFYLIVVLGGGWAMLAHLGLVSEPAPLDWLTLFTVLLYAAGFIAVGRRRLLTR